ARALRGRDVCASLWKPMRLDPRWRVIFLAVVAIGALFLHRPLAIAALVAGLAILWVAVGLGSRALYRQCVKFAGFAVFVVVMYALTGEDGATGRWIRFGSDDFGLWLNAAGALTGLLMALRVLAIVLASQVARAGDARALSAGLAGLGLPRAASACLDTVL